MKGIYKKLLNEINYHKNIYEAAEVSYKYYKKLVDKSGPKDISAISYDGMPKGSRNDMDFKKVVDEISKWESIMFLEKSIIDKLEEKKAVIDNCINNMNIEVKVSTLRALGLTQEEVAEMVDRSTRQVQNIEYKFKKE